MEPKRTGKPRPTKSKSAAGAHARETVAHRVELVMSEARNAGLVGGPKDTIIRGRVSKNLVRAAKKRAGVTSDTELLEIALSSFALEDDFGEKFLKRKGSIDADLALEF